MYNEKTIERLKQKILDLAIRGKLVPQDPRDEPASVLIEKIRKEKEKLIKEGKIKKPKEDSFIFKGSDNLYYENVNGKVKCIQDEIPFEIPNNWCWSRLNELGIYSKGPFGSNLTKDMFVNEKSKNRIKVYEQKNAIEKDYSLGHYYISQNKFKKMQSYVVVSGDIIVSCAGTIGEIYELPSKAEIGIINQALMRIKLYHSIIKQYFLLYFDYVLKNESNEKGKGTGIKNIPPFSVLKNMLMPIPSENELLMIVDKINLLKCIFKKIDIENANILKIKKKIKIRVLDGIFSGNSSYKSYYENDFNLGDILEYEQPGPYIVKNTDYNDNFDIPVLTPGKTFILGYTDEKDGIYKATKDNKVIIFDDFTTASRLVDFNFKVKSSAMKILHISDESKFDIEYMYYLLQTINIIVDTHKRFWISEYAPLKVKIHTFEEQVKIKNKIKNAFEIIDNL